MIEKIQVLKDVKKELERFRRKLDMAIIEQDNERTTNNRCYASAKRSALDLKFELTKLTQDSKYRWNRQ